MDTHESRNDGPPGGQSSAQVALLPHQVALVRELEFRPEDVMWERNPGQWELNPLLLARIAERIHFDGDVPELRFSNLPEGGKPAVPVLTETTNPVLLGLCLQKASEQVQEELEAARRLWDDAPELVESEGLATIVDSLPVFSAVGYVPGQVPIPRRVEASPIEASSLSQKEQQQAAFSAIATTQGRVSSLLLLTQTLLESLQTEGWKVRLGREGVALLSQATWTLQISHAEETNPRFSPLAVAMSSLIRDLLRGLPKSTRELVLVVRPLHAVHERTVGWKASLYEG